jgi:hypothetical protein
VPVLPDPPDFRELLRRHLTAIGEADDACRAAAEARRQTYHAARRDGLNTTLIKLLVREKSLDPESLEELADYRDAAASWSRTPLAQAAQ